MIMPTPDYPFCPSCGGFHEEDPEDCWVDWNGYRFRRPFRCICCGIEICARQFAFGRACGRCDVGACEPENGVFQLSVAHPHPTWWDFDGKKMFRKFVEVTKAEVLA